MANSEIFLIPQDPTATDVVVFLTDAQIQAGYQFDAVTKFATNYTYKPTNHSVPSGTFIADHVVKNPKRFTLTGILTPYNVLSPIRVLTLSGPALATARVALAGQTATAIENVTRKYQKLIEMADAFTPLTIIGNLFQHINMVITSIDDPKTPELGDGFQLSVRFQQIRIATQATQIAPIIATDASKLGGSSSIFKDR